MKFEAYRRDDGAYRCRFVDDDGVAVPIKVGSIVAVDGAHDPEIERTIDGMLQRMIEADARPAG